jgi:hypothetical protein
MTRFRILALLVGGLGLGLFLAPLAAEMTPREAQRYCVDIVLLKGGAELRGSLLARTPELKIAVQRDWLTAHQPEMAKQAAELESQQQKLNRQVLSDRITSWRKDRADQPRLTFVLDRELDLLTQPEPPKAAPSQFLIVEVPSDRVRRIFEAPATSRNLAAAAWFERLERVEETVMSKLKTQVEPTHPQWATEKFDISDRLPRGQPQSDDEWAARQALWEFDFCQELNFQGTGNFVMRVEAGQKPDLAALLSQSGESLLGGQLDLLGLGDLGLEGAKPKAPVPETWPNKAIAEATKLGIRGFVVTRSEQITGEGPAVVTSQFFARLSDGKYRAIWSDQVSTDPATIPAADLKRIEDDPQIQEVLKVAKALQFGNEAQQAVRFGGAVEVSLNSTQRHFAEFRARYNRTLDGPPLVISAPTP